mgnify:CR=1 FL=1|jgi:hypothetical protein|tara:strand:- start:41 stop:517 length:477 start_codon:yes stop_codon:yes gene_type:complete
MSCKCEISPRHLKLGDWFSHKTDFVNVCLECGGRGGIAGNVNHLPECKYGLCFHDGRFHVKYSSFVHEHDDGLNTTYGGWSKHQPTANIRNYHLECMKTRKDEIELARRKMSRNNMLKVYALIQVKTGTNLNLYVGDNGYFDSDKYIQKWIQILSKSK